MNSEDMADGIRGRLNPFTTQPVPETAAVRVPPRIADHTMLGRIGGGSYGDVWLARSTTGQLRAVKVVWRQQFSSERPYEREFHGIVQFEPISRSHPGVVSVLHVGRDDAAGCFFYVMELADAASERSNGVMESWADGKTAATQHSNTPLLQHSVSYSPRTLSSDLKAHGRLPVPEVLRLGIQLADALGHLHRHGLVHRDVKPSNVIFVHGQSKLADIGLVTSVQEARSFVGTEGFIPPEGPGTEKADLFALGRLLYEAATSKDRCEFPHLPGDLENWPASEREALLELNEVLAKLCAPDLAHRHANAAEVAGDLNLLLAGRSVRRAYGIERRLRRAKQVSIVALAVVVLAAGVVAFQRFRQRQAETRAAQERALRQRAEAAEHETRRQLYTALLEQGRATVLSGELGQRVRALDAVRRAGAISNSAAVRGVAVAALALPDLRFERELPYGEEFALIPDPSFERIALCPHRGPVEIRSTSDLRLLATLPASTNLPVYVVEWSADGRFLAVKRDYPGGGARADWEIWELAGPRQILLLRDAPFDALAFHPRLPRVLVGQSTGAAVWDLERGGEISRFQLAGTPTWLRSAPNGERFAALYSTASGWFVSVHNVTNTTAPPLASHAFADKPAKFNWHPAGRWLAVADFGGNVHRMDAQTGETRVLGRHKAQAVRVEFSPDGAYLVSGGWDRELICWDAQTLRRSFTAFLNGFVGMFRSDGKAYALATQTAVQLHAFERPSGHREFAEDLGPLLRYAAFSEDSRWLAAAGTERTGIWDLQSGGPAALATNEGPTRVCFAANGELFADRFGRCFRWRLSPATNAASPPQLSPLALVSPERFTSLCVISNGVVLTSEHRSAVVGPGEMGTGPRGWQPTVWGYNGVSPDGHWLAVFRPFTPHLFVHRLPGLERVAILTNASNVARFRFSPAGDELAVSCRSHVEFWSTATWQRTRSLTNFNGQLYSADGQTMWLMQEIRTVGLHDSRTLELLTPLPIGTFPLAVSPDGRRLAVSVDLRRLQVWDLTEMRERFRELGLDWPRQ